MRPFTYLRQESVQDAVRAYPLADVLPVEPDVGHVHGALEHGRCAGQVRIQRADPGRRRPVDRQRLRTPVFVRVPGILEPSRQHAGEAISPVVLVPGGVARGVAPAVAGADRARGQARARAGAAVGAVATSTTMVLR